MFAWSFLTRGNCHSTCFIVTSFLLFAFFLSFFYQCLMSLPFSRRFLTKGARV